MRTKRTFLAISIPCSSDFPALLERLKKSLTHEKYIHYVKTNQIHLTLKFLGSTPENDIPAIIESCQKVAKNHESFTMDFNNFGLFESNRVPNVLWLGMNDQPQALFKLKSDLEDAFEAIGYPRDEQDFRPHVTLCRMGTLVDKALFMRIYNRLEQKRYLHADVRELVYFQSFLQPTGPFYKVLKKIPLGGQ